MNWLARLFGRKEPKPERWSRKRYKDAVEASSGRSPGYYWVLLDGAYEDYYDSGCWVALKWNGVKFCIPKPGPNCGVRQIGEYIPSPVEKPPRDWMC